MSEENGELELYRKHRPQKLSDLKGQDEAVKMLQDLGRRGAIPHCLLLSGPSGCGKTTIARILKEKLGCSDRDFTELNIADVRGIDTIREIRSRIHASPIGGRCRIWLLDEAARATVDAQNSLLKMLEDTPAWVYFILATTEPQKLLATIKTRATEVKVKLLSDKVMSELLSGIAGKEGFKLSGDVKEQIAAVAGGSPRKALVLLNQIIGLTDEESQMAVVVAGESSAQMIELARALVKPGVRWSEVAKLLKAIEEEPEAVRRMVLGYCSSIVLGGGALAAKAYDLILCFEKNFFDSGKAGLTAACYEACLPPKKG
jgi:DNA polymerase-3 subunit gamma/tau